MGVSVAHLVVDRHLYTLQLFPTRDAVDGFGVAGERDEPVAFNEDLAGDGLLGCGASS
ncbi:hypothetical protein [Mycobacterium tuberculosis]|uniref:hypothetical protein n=1 Tax=Mycobacterium tuberculosis TaxID=1773 RepID=UPI00130E66B0|nr:hypothetical protein [Mycobacterium tuberculosis]